MLCRLFPLNSSLGTMFSFCVICACNYFMRGSVLTSPIESFKRFLGHVAIWEIIALVYSDSLMETFRDCLSFTDEYETGSLVGGMRFR